MRTQTFRITQIAAAVLAAFGAPALAAEDVEITELTKPSSTVSAGVGYATEDGRRFGQYNGIKDEGFYPLLDLDYRRRDDATGTWYTLRGRNLGLDNREIRFDHNRQGDWGYFLEFGQTPRYEPFTAITGLTGFNSGNQVINGVGLRPLDLKTRRDTLGLGFDKIIAGGFDFQVRFKNEEKEGARLYGQGDNPGNPVTRFLADPIDYTIRQWEAIANYTTQQLQLTAGYYGTSFDNKITALNLAGNPAPIFNPMALPPGNQSHQLYVAGGYNITPTTRASFKLAYTHQTQDEAFIAPAVNGRTNLDGKVDTKLAQFGLTAAPLPRLSLVANLRYEDRHDKTPIFLYFTGTTPTSTLSGTNEPRSIKTTSGKLEASYQLPYGFRVLGGFDYEEKDRNTFAVRAVSHRDQTEEKSYRAEVRRTIGETLTGSLGYVHSDREGSPFLTTVLLNGTLGSNLIAPLHLADRDRDKIRASLTWMPMDPLTLQFTADHAKDDYSQRTAAALGPRNGRAETYSVDASYALTDTWQANAWYTMNDLKASQASLSGNTTWGADIKSDSDSFGVGIRGKPMSRLEIGADAQYTDVKDSFRVFTVSGPAAVSNIPDIRTKLTRLELFGRYAIQKNMGVRVNYIYDRWRSDEWTWTGFVYSDGTRLIQDPDQKVHFIGVSMYYNFR
jgi:MtrB/PioB family decaheme-associated outer membrane protein